MNCWEWTGRVGQDKFSKWDLWTSEYIQKLKKRKDYFRTGLFDLSPVEIFCCILLCWKVLPVHWVFSNILASTHRTPPQAVMHKNVSLYFQTSPGREISFLPTRTTLLGKPTSRFSTSPWTLHITDMAQSLVCPQSILQQGNTNPELSFRIQTYFWKFWSLMLKTVYFDLCEDILNYKMSDRNNDSFYLRKSLFSFGLTKKKKKRKKGK